MRVLVLLLCTVTAWAQPTSDPSQTVASALALLELDGTPQRPVLVTPPFVIRAADDPLSEGLTPSQRAMQPSNRIYDGMVSVELSVVLDLNGRVESAKPIRGPQRFYDQAVELELHRAFEPVHDKNGTILHAHFTDYVRVEPPERWLDHSPGFPERVDLSTFRIALERTTCYGSCPPYKVTISGSGDVLWEGGPNVAVPGMHHATISHEAVQELVNQVRASHMLNALDKYQAGWTDNPTYTLTLDANGLHKQVVDYIGPIVGMPTSIRELEEAIDRIAGTEKWIKGNAELMPALAAEHWNFAANSKDNLQLYDSTLTQGNRELLAAFTAARGPVFSSDPAIESPACVASGSMDSHWVLDMLATVPKDRKLPQHALDECLVNAAREGNLELVNLWLKRGASLNPTPPPKFDSSSDAERIPELDHPLTAAVQGGSPAMVQRLLDAHAPVDPANNGGRNLVAYAVEDCSAHNSEDKETILKMLLDAGADPNQETERDRPAIFAVNYEPELVPLLVAGGFTPLMSVTDTKALRALLEAGADPTLRNRQGQTAGEQFRAEGAKEQADLLDAAVKARLGSAGAKPSDSTPATQR